MKTAKTFSDLGFTLMEVMIVVAIICLVVALAIPNFEKSRATSQANVCINNLRQISAAAKEFALEQAKTSGARINFPNDLTPYIKLNSSGSIPACPAGGTYSDPSVDSMPACSLGSVIIPAHVLP